jgi:cysteine desulfurase
LAYGGGQERGIRPGTVPVALAVGFGQASMLSMHEHLLRSESTRSVRRSLLFELEKIKYVQNGDWLKCQDHVMNIRFPGVDSEAIMMAMRKSLAFSNGSACTSDSYHSSHVLLAMGLSVDEADESIRLSWGHSDLIVIEDLLSAINKFKMN